MDQGTSWGWWDESDYKGKKHFFIWSLVTESGARGVQKKSRRDHRFSGISFRVKVTSCAAWGHFALLQPCHRKKLLQYRYTYTLTGHVDRSPMSPALYKCIYTTLGRCINAFIQRWGNVSLAFVGEAVGLLTKWLVWLAGLRWAICSKSSHNSLVRTARSAPPSFRLHAPNNTRTDGAPYPADVRRWFGTVPESGDAAPASSSMVHRANTDIGPMLYFRFAQIQLICAICQSLFDRGVYLLIKSLVSVN